jgi:hypothetical protein
MGLSPDPRTEPAPDLSRNRGKLMAAKCKGRCRWCTFEYARGQAIYWDSVLGPAHVDCAREREQIERMGIP